MAAIQYNRVIRKLVVAFGDLFNNIKIAKFNPDLTESERILIPIAYATKERYVMRLEDDFNLDKKVQIALPRFSYEMTGMEYDVSRKLNTNIKNYAQTNTGIIGQYNPVPYDFDFNLYLYVRNIEDASQVIEHILPFFTPDYTLKLDLIADMGIIKEVPIIFKSADHEIIYEGDREQETRMIIWTFRFTVKGFIFGKTSTTNVIRTSITNILNGIGEQDVVQFNMVAPGVGNYRIGETVYQGYSFSTAVATATVVDWANNILKLTDVLGNFTSSQPIVGASTNASYVYSSYNVASLQPRKLVEIEITPNPSNANASNLHTYTTQITEY